MVSAHPEPDIARTLGTTRAARRRQWLTRAIVAMAWAPAIVVTSERRLRSRLPLWICFDQTNRARRTVNSTDVRRQHTRVLPCG